MSALERLAEEVRQEGGLLADALGPASAAGPGSPARVAIQGPRARARAGEYELLLEAVYEGYLLHYARSRLLRQPDPDLALLAGDRLYALGLARLVEMGDLEAVAELADVISLCALAHASGDPELAQAVWAAGAVAVGWGSSPAHARAKALAREMAPAAARAMRQAGVPRAS